MNFFRKILSNELIYGIIHTIQSKIYIQLIELLIYIGIEKQLSTTSDSTTGALVHASKFINMGKFYVLSSLQEYIHVEIKQEICFITANHAFHNLSCWFSKCVVKMGKGEGGGGVNENYFSVERNYW